MIESVMIQHAVPQQISAFKFRLFGNLTVREFAFVGSGFLISFLILVSPLNFLLKVPLIIFFGGGGGALGLMPIQGRPFDQWIYQFFKAIMSPTQRIWQKSAELPNFLQPAIQPAAGPTLTPFTLTESRLRLEEYLQKIPKEEPSSLDAAEQIFLEHLDFESELPAQIAVSTAVSKKKKKEEIKEEVVLPVSPKQAAVKTSDDLAKISLAGLDKEKRKPKPKLREGPQLASEVNFVKEPVFALLSPDAQIQLHPGVGQIRVRRLHSSPPVSGEIKIPIRGERRFELSDELRSKLGIEIEEEPKKQTKTQPQPKTKADVTTTVPPFKPKAPSVAVKPDTSSSPPISLGQGGPVPPQPITKPSQKSVSLRRDEPTPTTATTKPLPSDQKQRLKAGPTFEAKSKPAKIKILTSEKTQDQESQKPTANLPNVTSANVADISPITHIPNVLNGIALDKSGSILENTIILVKNEAQTPVRALKTNKLGQFAIATPLPNGRYTVEAEKEGYNFDIIEVQTQGIVMPPIEIRAK